MVVEQAVEDFAETPHVDRFLAVVLELKG